MSAGGTDQDILELAQHPSTEQESFSLLYKNYAQKLYWHIRGMVSNHEDTDDVLQDVMVKAWRGIKRFRGESKLSTWLYRIATNETITFLGKRNKRQTASIDGDDDYLHDTMKADQSVDGDIVMLKLGKAMSGLPEKQKLVFTMRYFDEMTYDEISKVLGTSVGALKASYHHAVNKIEKFLTEND